MPTISAKIAKYLNGLKLPGASLEGKLQSLLEREYRRRLARYQHLDRTLQQKYGMSFQDFEAQGMVAQQRYSWNVESDMEDWELALDGMATVEQKLKELSDMRHG